MYSFCMSTYTGEFLGKRLYVLVLYVHLHRGVLRKTSICTRFVCPLTQGSSKENVYMYSFCMSTYTGEFLGKRLYVLVLYVHLHRGVLRKTSICTRFVCPLTLGSSEKNVSLSTCYIMSTYICVFEKDY